MIFILRRKLYINIKDYFRDNAHLDLLYDQQMYDQKLE